MKIALIGWSGNGNWGDERMHYCTTRFFKKHTIVRFTSFLDAILNIHKVNQCDYVLIGGGGLIFRGFNRYCELLHSITPPLGCIGISIEAERLHEDMEAGLAILKEKADFIYVRDEKSRTLLGNHHKVIVGPDIAFLYPYKPAKEIMSDTCAINLRDWFWWDLELHTPLHERLVRWNVRYPWIKHIYPFRTWNSQKCMTILTSPFKKLIPFPLYFGIEGVSDVTVLQRHFTPVAKTFSLKLLQRSRYLVGMRLHALIFATQMGIPFISLSYEPKNSNYCASIGHPELSLPLLKYRQVDQKIAYLKEHYTSLRRDLLAYTKTAQRDTEHIFVAIEKLMRARSKER